MTAMIELREFVCNGYDTHQELIDKINELIPKERDQIEEAVIWGAENEYGLTRTQAEEYYNKTYKPG